MRLRLIASLLFSLGLFAPACATSKAAGPMPEGLSFRLRDLSGKTVGTADFPGRVLLVDFWATWCKPCEHSFPFYSDLQKQLEAEGLTVLAISVDQTDEAVAEFVERHPVSFRILRDPQGNVARSIEQSIESMPTAVLVGRDGRVALIHTGFQSGDEEKLTAAVKVALAEPQATPRSRETAPSPGTAPAAPEGEPASAPRENSP